MKKYIAILLTAVLVSCATPWKPENTDANGPIPEAVEQAIAAWIEQNTKPVQPPATTNAPPVVIVTPPPASTNQPPVIVTPPPVEPPAATLTPAQRMKLWYPKAMDYNHKPGPVNEEALWKPVSDNGGVLVLVLPHSKWGRITRVQVDTEVIEQPYAHANGYRPQYKFRKKGGEYLGNLLVTTSSGTLAVKIKSPGTRTIIKDLPK